MVETRHKKKHSKPNSPKCKDAQSPTNSKKSKAKIGKPAHSPSKTPTKSQSDPTQECPCKQDTDSRWIECSKCFQWWHQDCLGYNNSLFKKIQHGYFLCPLCSIHLLKPDVRIFARITETVKDFGVEIDSQSKQNVVEPSPVKAQDPLTAEPKNKNQIVVLDNIGDSSKFQNSASILKEVKKHKPKVDVQLAYPLAGGGLVLHCRSEQSTTEALEDWPQGAFGSEQIRPHPPASRSQKQTVIVRSVSTKIEISELERHLTGTLNCQVTARRLYNRSSGNPYPLVKLTTTREIAAKLICSGINLFGKVYNCEPLHSRKIIRCYNCQRFGHCAASCKYSPVCCNCSGNHPPTLRCTLPPKCHNCEGEHSADHKLCPSYRTLFSKLTSTHGIIHL